MAIDPNDPSLQAPPGLQGSDTGIPTTVDLSNGGGSLAGPGGLYVDASGRPITQSNADGSKIALGVDGQWHQIQPPTSKAPTTGSARPVSVPRSGIIYDPTTHRFVNAYTDQTYGPGDPSAGGAGAGAGWNPMLTYSGYHPTLALNPGQSVADTQGHITGHVPLYDPQQYQLLADQAKHQYQNALMEAERAWQSDRDVQAFRQATLQAQTDYANQLLHIQRATLQAQTAVQDRQMAQPMMHDNPDGSVQTILPSAMVGTAFGGKYGLPGTDWSHLLDSDPMQTPQMQHGAPQSIPELGGPQDSPNDLALRPLPPVAGSPTPWTQGIPHGATDSHSAGYPGSAPTPDLAGAHRTPEGTLLYPGSVDANALPSIPSIPSIPTPSDSLTNPLGTGNGLAPQSPDTSPFGQAGEPSLNGTSGWMDDAGLPTSAGSNASSDLLPPEGVVDSGYGGAAPSAPSAPSAPQAPSAGGRSAAPDVGSALGSFTSAIASILGPDPSRAGPHHAPPHYQQPGWHYNMLSGEWEPDNGLDPRTGGAFGGTYGPEAQDSLFGPSTPGGIPNDYRQANPDFQPPAFGGGGGEWGFGSGAGDDDLSAIGAGPNLGQPMATPPGGIQAPIDPSQVMGMGHRFGEDTGDETPWHKGVDFQAFQGTPVMSPVEGVVTDAGDHQDLGLAVDISDGMGQQHELNHLSAIDVANGSQVHQGQVVGLVGSTGNSSGPHLDYRARGTSGDFTDPMSQPAIAGALDGLPDMSGAGHGGGEWPFNLGSGEGEDYDGSQSGDQTSGDSTDGWNPGDQYNQQEPDGSWSQVTVGGDGSFSSSTIDPSGYGSAGIPWPTGGTDQQQTQQQSDQNLSNFLGSNGYPQPNVDSSGMVSWPTGSTSSPVSAATAAGVVQPTGSTPSPTRPPGPQGPAEPQAGRNPYPSPYVPHGFHVTTDGMYDYFTDDSGAFLGYNKHFDPAQINAQRDAWLAEQGGTTMDVQKQQLDAAYQQALLQASSAKERLQLQIAYQQAHDQLVAGSNERIAGTNARANVLSTWGRAAAASPWLARMSGRTPTPGDVGSGTGYGQQSASSQQLLTGQGQQPSTWQEMISPAGGTTWSGGQLGWSGGGDRYVGSGDDGTGDMNQGTTPGTGPDPLGAAASSGFGNSIDDLSGGTTSHPTATQWDSMGPFGHTALRYSLESAGDNWAPYAESMLSDWRSTGQTSPSGLSGWGIPDMTHLGFESLSPIGHENWQQDAELFGPYSDYTTRLGRDWFGAGRNMSSIHG